MDVVELNVQCGNRETNRLGARCGQDHMTRCCYILGCGVSTVLVDSKYNQLPSKSRVYYESIKRELKIRPILVSL